MFIRACFSGYSQEKQTAGNSIRDLKSQIQKGSVQRKTVKEQLAFLSLAGGPLRLMHPVDQPPDMNVPFPSCKALLLLHQIFMYHTLVYFMESYQSPKWKKWILHRESGEVLAVFMCALQTSKIEWWDGAGVEEMVGWRMAGSPEQLISKTSQSHSLSPSKSLHLQRPSTGSPCVPSPLDPPSSFLHDFLFVQHQFSLSLFPIQGDPVLPFTQIHPSIHSWMVARGDDLQDHSYVLYSRDMVIKQIFITLDWEPHLLLGSQLLTFKRNLQSRN